MPGKTHRRRCRFFRFAAPLAFSAASLAPAQEAVRPQTVPAAAVCSDQSIGTEREAADVETHLSTNPHDDAARLRLLRFYAATARMAAARKHTMYLIEQRPESLEALMATIFWSDASGRSGDRGDIQRLAEVWKRMADQKPDSAQVLANAAQVMEAAGFGDYAQAFLQRALALDPEYPSAKAAMKLDEQPGSPASQRPPRPLHRVVVPAHVQEKKLVERRLPEYPEEARRLWSDGTVSFLAVIGKDGGVKSLETVRGHPMLVEAAKDAARQWRYQPTLVDGEPVEVMTRLDVLFSLPAKASKIKENKWHSAVPVEELSVRPQPVYVAAPEYTDHARNFGLEGSVLVGIIIDHKGIVREANVLRGLGLGLDQKAVDAVLKWRFKPGMQDGKPVPCRASVEVNFRAWRPSR